MPGDVWTDEETRHLRQIGSEDEIQREPVQVQFVCRRTLQGIVSKMDLALRSVDASKSRTELGKIDLAKLELDMETAIDNQL